MKEIKIGNRFIGEGHPAYIIAEMSANHAGSIERAKEIIREAKRCGADCVKIQTYTPDTLTIDCHNPYFQIESGTWEGENLYGLYGKAYTPWEWHKELKEEADRVGIDFLSTPFDNTAVDFLEELGMQFYKIASFEMIDLPLLSYVAATGKPIIMSTGMATLAEMEEAVETIYAKGNHNLALLKCSSAYPADPADMHLKTIADMREKFDLPIGLSDHSMGSMSAVTAVALGASIIEKHFCISREIENPDASFSMTPDEFGQMVEDIRRTESALGKAMYGASKQEEGSLIFRRSVFVTKDMKEGETFTEENIRVIRPGYGLHPREYAFALGRKSLGNLRRGMPLTADDISDYLTFRKAGKSDMQMVFDWANEEETRKQSFSTKPITWEEHVAWYEKSLNSRDRYLFICMHGDIPVGLFRIDRLEEAIGEISYSIDKKYRGRGYALEMLKAGEEVLKKNRIIVWDLLAKVKKDNEASRHIFKVLGFKETEEDNCFVYTKPVE